MPVDGWRARPKREILPAFSRQEGSMNRDAPTVARRAVPLREIAGVFTRIGIASFGGGLVGWMHREAVERRCWLPDHQFLSGLALSQVLPGANMVNLSLYLGMELRGGLGALTAAVGLLLLPILCIIGLYEIYAEFRGIAALHLVLDGA